jgi:hypothetical protein
LRLRQLLLSAKGSSMADSMLLALSEPTSKTDTCSTCATGRACWQAQVGAALAGQAALRAVKAPLATTAHCAMPD